MWAHFIGTLITGMNWKQRRSALHSRFQAAHLIGNKQKLPFLLLNTLFLLLYHRSILLFPKGNNQKKSTSVYLQIANPKESGIEEGWHVCAQFALAISNPGDPTLYFANSKI